MKCPLRHDRRFLSSLPSVLFLSRFIPSSFFPTRHLTIVFIRFSFSYGTHTSSHAAQSLSERNLIDHFLILFSPMNLAEWLQRRALGPFFCLFVFFLGGRGDATRPSQWILNYRASRGPFWKRTEKPLVGSTDYDRKKRKRPETHRATYRSAYTNNEELFRHPTPNSSKRGNWEGGAGLRAHSVGSGECRTGRWR